MSLGLPTSEFASWAVPGTNHHSIGGVSAPMHYRLTAAVAALALSLGLTACGADESEGTAGKGAAGDDFPATVATEFGDVTIDEAPERVVALGWGDAETALALGVQPVGASDWLGFEGEGVGPWADGLYDEAPELIETLEPSYEQIASLKPDLILDVKSSGEQERYDRLSQIAPTVAIPEGKQSFLTSMEEQVTMISTALGAPEKGEELLADVEQQFADAAAEHPEFQDKTISVAAFTSEGWGAYIQGNERVAFMERLGFEQNPAIEELTPEGFTAKLANEQIGVLDADLLVVFPIWLPATDVTDQPLFQQIPAVQDGRSIVFTDDDEDIRQSYSANTVLSVPFALESVVPMLADAIG